MGVMACSRRGCDNVMCDRRSREHGYICDECFEELVASGVGTDIDAFMNTKPKPKQDLTEATHAFFDRIFPVDRDDRY